MHDRGPAALEERPAGPQHDRRGEQRTAARSTSRGDTRSCRPSAGIWPPISSTTTGRVSASPIQKRRVMSTSSGFGPASAVTVERLQRHAADRAAAGPLLPDLRDASGRCRSSPFGGWRGAAVFRRRQVARRVGDELRRGSRPSRSGRSCPSCSNAMPGGGRVHLHAADRIGRAWRHDPAPAP